MFTYRLVIMMTENCIHLDDQFIKRQGDQYYIRVSMKLVDTKNLRLDTEYQITLTEKNISQGLTQNDEKIRQ